MTTWEDFRAGRGDWWKGCQGFSAATTATRSLPPKNGWVEVKACTFLLSILELKVFLFTVWKYKKKKQQEQ